MAVTRDVFNIGSIAREDVPKRSKGKSVFRKPLKAKMVVDPEWLASEEVQEDLRDRIVETSLDGRSDLMSFFPEDYKARLPEEGGWILVKTPPPTAIKIPALSIFFAIPDVDTLTDVPGTNGSVQLPRYKVRITTPEGELHLLPWEYTVITDIKNYMDFLDNEHFNIHYLSDKSEVNADKLFYLRARGISKQEAYTLLIGDLKDPNFCYFTFHPAYAELFGF